MDYRETSRKQNGLAENLRRLDSLLVAFSGGVDSSYLLAMAFKILGEKTIAVTARSPVHPERETEAAGNFAKHLGVEHLMIETTELSLSEFTANPRDRCYVCKKNLFAELKKIAEKKGVERIAHGANLDDLNDFRPGFRAAGEMGIIAPLIDAGLSKSDIRTLSREMNLETWNKPSMACLATRIPYGSRITPENLKMAEQGENAIFDLGFSVCRVRIHGGIARIELDPDEIEKAVSEPVRSTIIKKFGEIGFSHTAVDMEGYSQGSMNRQKS